jgi:hypothetical protein
VIVTLGSSTVSAVVVSMTRSLLILRVAELSSAFVNTTSTSIQLQFQSHVPAFLTSDPRTSTILVYRAPTVTHMQPRSGPVTGGTIISIVGVFPIAFQPVTVFGSFHHAVNCTGSTTRSASAVSALEHNTLSCTTPEGMPEGASSVSVSVDNPVYVARQFSASPHQLLVYREFSLSSFSPRHLVAATQLTGSQLVVLGANFTATGMQSMTRVSLTCGRSLI